MNDKRGDSLSGLTAGEAQEFHGFFMSSFIGFVIVAVVAHILVWMWRPWFPGVDGYSSSMIDGVKVAASNLMTFIG
ncbi:MAG: light-harvesting antenna LH1, beta subunit [Alphaproteobacteria bacterium]|nr:light-harvesting antenna LH1, beta subunit [Alphaproteobacteria bacterium]